MDVLTDAEKNIDTASKYNNLRDLLWDKFQINVISIVIGGFLVFVLIAWVETIRSFCSGVLGDEKDEKRYFNAWKKFIIALFMSLLFIFIVILLLVYEHQRGLL